MARKLAVRTDSDTISVTKYIKWVEPAEFLETIVPFASDKDEATKEAKRHLDDPDEQSF